MTALLRTTSALAAAGVLGLAGAAQAAAQAPVVAPAPAPGTLYLYPERIPLEAGGFATADRGWIFVPAVRDEPGSPVLAVEVYRFRRSDAADPATPPIFILNGGPGWPGLEPALSRPGTYERQIQGLRDVADVVVVGQRGIGSSKPNTICERPAPAAPAAPADPARRAAAVQQASRLCRDFWRDAGVPLDAFSVIEAAGDVADLTRALGYDAITLWGGSFGSHWSMAVLRFHPGIVARAFLSGMEGPDHTYDDPSGVLAAVAGIAAAADTASALREHVPPGGLLAALREVIARAEREPIVVRVKDRNGQAHTVRLDADAIRDMALGYTSSTGSRGGMRTWPSDVIALWRGEYEAAARERLPGPGGPFRTASYFMLDCGSGITGERWERLEADTAMATVGDLTWWYETSCEAWPADLGDAFRLGFHTDVPALIVHGTWDTSTPLVNALELADAFENGRLVIVDGGSHGAPYEAMELVPGFREEVMEFVATGDTEGIPDRVALPPVEWVVPGAEGRR